MLASRLVYVRRLRGNGWAGCGCRVPRPRVRASRSCPRRLWEIRALKWKVTLRLLIERMPYNDGLFAVRPGGDHIHRHAADLLQTRQVGTRICGQRIEPLCPYRALGPPRHLLVDRHAIVGGVGARGKDVQGRAADPVADAELDSLHAVEHVELGDAQSRYAVDLNRALEHRGIEPAAAARPARDRAEFI